MSEMVERPDRRIRHAFSYGSITDMARMISFVHEMGQTPEAFEISYRDWGYLESFAHGLGSHPCFLRWPIERSMREMSALRVSEEVE